MPETYGLPEEEPTRIEVAQRAANEVIAGKGVVRRVVLYATLIACLAFLFSLGGTAAAVGALVGGGIAVVLLMATDSLL